MTYIIKYDDGREKDLTEREVRDLIIEDQQSDMGKQYSDEEIVRIVNEGNVEDYFDGDEYESGDYTIIRNH